MNPKVKSRVYKGEKTKQRFATISLTSEIGRKVEIHHLSLPIILFCLLVKSPHDKENYNNQRVEKNEEVDIFSFAVRHENLNRKSCCG